jgi:hypothetical protein
MLHIYIPLANDSSRLDQTVSNHSSPLQDHPQNNGQVEQYLGLGYEAGGPTLQRSTAGLLATPNPPTALLIKRPLSQTKINA